MKQNEEEEHGSIARFELNLPGNRVEAETLLEYRRRFKNQKERAWGKGSLANPAFNSLADWIRGKCNCREGIMWGLMV